MENNTSSPIREKNDSLVENTLRQLNDNRERILNGKVNCIPSPFKKFSREFTGLEKSMYSIITSYTKGGKSQFSSFTLLYNSLLTAFAHKNFKVTILYFNLEESKERIMQRFISYIINIKSKGKYWYSPKELRSTDKYTPVHKDVFDYIQSAPIKEIMDYFEENVIFSEEKNPTGIYKFCVNYAITHGKETRKKVIFKDEFGNPEEHELFESFEWDNPEEYVIPYIDTINCISTEKGMSLKQSIDKMSEYCYKELRNKYQMSPIVIQQQNTAGETVEAVKFKKNRPSKAGLGDSTYTGHDANLIMGLFSPYAFGIDSYLGYDITIFRDNIRFLEILASRDGESGGLIALFFDGATCNFFELPKADDEAALQKVYSYIQTLNIKKENRNAVRQFNIMNEKKLLHGDPDVSDTQFI